MNRTEPINELRLILGRLKRAEKESLRSYLVAFDSHAVNGVNKSVRVTDYLLENPMADKEELIQKLDLPADKYNFNKFITRLQDKVLECLTLSVNTNRKGAYSSWYANKVDVRKKLIEAQTLLGRGLEQLAYKTYKDCAKRSDKYELYEEGLEAYRFLQHQLAISHGVKKFEKYQDKIDHLNKCLEATWRARSFYAMHFAMVDKESSKNDKIGFLTEAIAQMQNDLEQTGSDNVNFFLHYLLMEFYLVFDDHRKVRKTGNQMVDLLLDSPAVFNRQRLANVYMDLGDNELHFGDLKAARDNLDLSISEHPKGGLNHIRAEMLYCYCLYYNGELDEAYSKLCEVLKFPLIEDQHFEREQLLYIKAAIEFHKGETNQAFKITEHEISSLLEDSRGWNIGLRVFHIICCIELGYTDMAYGRTENLKRHIQKLKRNQQIRKRDKHIVKVLSKLAEFGYDFNKAYPACKYSLTQLQQQDDEELRWQPRSHEPIIIDRWFNAKQEGRKYKFSFPEAPEADYSFITEETAKTLEHAESILH